jgi:hypothetical protein
MNENGGGGGASDNELYSGDNGGSSTGDTYSYGTIATTERALGSLMSGVYILIIETLNSKAIVRLVKH